MPANALVQTRIDSKLKTDAAEVLAGVGLSISDAVRLMLVQVVERNALPFDIRTPNAKTRAAMREADAIIQSRKLRFANAETLFNDLDKKARK